MLTVRHAVDTDLDNLVRAHVDAWRVAYRGLIPDSYLDSASFEPERVAMWTRTLARAADHVLVADIDGRAMGFGFVGAARGDEHDEQVGEVYSFYVHPSVWGSGAAVAVMDACLAQLRDEGFTSAVLWVLRDNPRARRFYEKCGWFATGEESAWEGPQTASALPAPVVEVQYAVDLR